LELLLDRLVLLPGDHRRIVAKTCGGKATHILETELVEPPEDHTYGMQSFVWNRKIVIQRRLGIIAVSLDEFARRNGKQSPSPEYPAVKIIVPEKSGRPSAHFAGKEPKRIIETNKDFAARA
jgi:hypothetical protein